MIYSNKRWLLTASPWMQNSPRLSALGIVGLVFCALFLFVGQSVNAQLISTSTEHTVLLPGGPVALGGLPAITGNTTICPTTTTTLANTTTGGTWSSSNTGVATVVSGTGVVTGVAGGIAYITYTVGSRYTAIAVTVTSPITGTATTCVGNSTFLADATTSGVWTSSAASVAQALLTGEIRGLSAGTAIISYGRPGACVVTLVVTVGTNALPNITGTTSGVCVGGTLTAANTTAGGVWSSSNTALATIGSSTGIVTGVAAGGLTITYTLAGCYKTQPLNVNAAGSIAAITGTASTCVGSNSVLADATAMGVWSSSNAGIAYVNTAGNVTGISVGTATISYTRGGCSVTRVFTVNANNIGSITGSGYTCVGGSLTLGDTTGSGTWSTTSTAYATVVAGTGVVTGVAAGAAIITYNVSGCFKTTTVNVSAATVVGAISGTTTLCQGTTSTLTDAIPGGAWSSSDPTLATVNAYGTLTGVAAGAGTITYTRLGCTSTTAFTINGNPTAITGTRKHCSNGTTTLASTPATGTWSGSSTAFATINSTSGVVTGVAPGVTLITYTLPTGCYATTTDTSYGPGAIGGGNSVCIAPSTYLYLTNTTLTGTWTSSFASVATVGAATGIVTGLVGGTTTITFTTPVSGLTCYVTNPVTVLYAPGAISGNTSMCTGATTTLLDTTTGGVWTSNNASIATVGSTTGVVTGVAAGAATITYSKNGCYKIANMVVATPPAAITGSTNVCTGMASVTYTDVTTGGVWSASNANVQVTPTGTTTALIYGASVGTATVSYTIGGCSVTKVANVTANGATTITGVPYVCTGLTTTLTSGGGAGAWTSANAAIGSISGSATGTSAAIMGVAYGNTVITYTVASTGCFKVIVFQTMTSPAAITGAYSLCNGTTTTLTDATTGGSWSTDNADVARVSASGVVTAVSPGHVSIGYTMTGGCTAYQPMNVYATPPTIGGTSNLCTSGITSSTLTNTLAGGTWSSTNTGVATINATSGLLTSVAAGTTIISYTVAGCSTAKTSIVGAVTPTFSGANPGPLTVCAVGSPSSAITVSNAGGTWLSSSNAIATISSSGVLQGVTAGTVTITYTLNGCYNTQVETVTANTLTPITGPSEVCVGSTATLANVTAGGAWASSNTAIGTISAVGVVGGVAAGATIISYTLPTGGCRQVISINFGNTTPAAIGGNAPVCLGNTVTLTDATAGATWYSSNDAVASVTTGGVVYGASAGTATISYVLLGCSATADVTVNPLPVAITGTNVVCEGATTTLANADGTGTWSSVTPAKATIDAGGVVTGVAFGTTVIRYTLGTSCYSTITVTVGGASSSLGGTTTVCSGNQTTLTTTKAGGTWSSSDPSIAFATGGTSAVITGVSGGTATISYTTLGCAPVTTVYTVNYVAPILGGSSVCIYPYDSMQLSDATAGGTWASSSLSLATIGSADGWINGVDAGNVTFTYLAANGCSATKVVNISRCGHRGVNNAGVATMEEEQVYTLFPNPSNGMVNIIQNIVEDQTMKVSVMNSVGAVVYNGNLEFRNGDGHMNLNVANGMYVILLQDNKGDIKTFKVVIDK